MMTKAKLTVDPHQTPEETAELVTRVAAAVSEAIGSDQTSLELEAENDRARPSDQRCREPHAAGGALDGLTAADVI